MRDHAPAQPAPIPTVQSGAQLETLISRLLVGAATAADQASAAATLSHMRAEARNG